MKPVLQYLLTLGVLVCVDFVLVSSVKDSYNTMIADIQGSPMEAKIIPALLAYPVMALGVFLFVIPKIRKENIILDAILYGASFGLVLYGTYDLTIYCVLTNWWLSVVIIEILGGMCVMTVVSGVVKAISLKIWGEDYEKTSLRE
jgi:uncharacterized membrane protein